MRIAGRPSVGSPFHRNIKSFWWAPIAGLTVIALLIAPSTSRFGRNGSAQHLFHGHSHGPELRVKATEEESDLASKLEPRIEPGGPAVTHKGEEWAPSSEGEIQLLRIGELGWEPTLGFTKNALLYQGMGAEETAGFYSRPFVYRTRDFGASWEDVTPEGEHHKYTADPYLYVDPDTSRTFTANWLGPCSALSWNDGGGDKEKWTSVVGACGLADHQNLFAGPPVHSETTDYPNVVYYCAIVGFGNASEGAGCQKSLDGGLTFVTTGGLPFHSDPDKGVGFADLPGHCSGAVAPGTVGDDGTIYLPAGQCGQPWLAISTNEGLTWDQVLVADNGMAQGDEGVLSGCETGLQDTTGPNDVIEEIDQVSAATNCTQDRTVWSHESGVATDAEGNVYYTWVAADHIAYLAVSHDGGKTWGQPIRVSPPNLTDVSLPALVVGDPGGVGIAYIGSDNAPPARSCGDEHWLTCRLEGGTIEEYYDGTTWNGYITVTKHALKEDPEFLTVAANPPDQPFERGWCSQFRCGELGDFFDVVIGPDGRPWAAFTDACLPEAQSVECEGPVFANAEGVVAHMVDGPKLVTGAPEHRGAGVR